MKKIKIIYVLILLILCGACKDKVFTSTFIGYYFTPLNLTSEYIFRANNFLEIDITTNYNEYYYFLSENDTKKEMFYKYSEYYGDTNYQRDDDNGQYMESSCYPLSCISVVSNKDWDDSHPANTSLNDLFYGAIFSFKEYIESNYNNNIEKYYYDTLSTMDYSKANPFGGLIKLYTKSRPTVADVHQLTISIEFGTDPITNKNISIKPTILEIDFTKE